MKNGGACGHEGGNPISADTEAPPPSSKGLPGLMGYGPFRLGAPASITLRTSQLIAVPGLPGPRRWEVP